jgi:hypothetical protein
LYESHSKAILVHLRDFHNLFNAKINFSIVYSGIELFVSLAIDKNLWSNQACFALSIK